MSVMFISGKPGGGKSLYGMRQLLDELRLGKRHIVTNLPVRIERLNEYLQEQGIELGEEHITDRITLLNEEQSGEFYRHRYPGDVVGEIPDFRGRRNIDGRGETLPDFSKCRGGGVLYIIDEVHIYFNARAWASTGAKVIYYLSQHRKLGDDVFLITQHIGNVDKQMRSMAQDYTYIRNLCKEKFGLFRLPAVFVRSTFLQPSTGIEKAMETGTFKLDMSGIASCYDTAKGVGIHGRSNADVGRKRRGLHWSVFVIGLPLLIGALVHYTPKAVAGYLTPKKRSMGNPVGGGSNLPPTAPSIAPGGLSGSNSVLPEVPKEVLMTGYVWFNGRIRVILSDGRHYRAGDGRLQYVCDTYCVVDGKTNWMSPQALDTNRPVQEVYQSYPVQAVGPAFPGGSGSSLSVIGRQYQEPKRLTFGPGSRQQFQPY